MNERHYSVKELAELWRFSAKTIRKLFKCEPGVVVLEGPGVMQNKRQHLTLSIPESVALRVYSRLNQPRATVELPKAKPVRRILKLRSSGKS